MGVVRAEPLLPDCQGALEQRRGLAYFALGPVQAGQVVEAGGGVRMVRAEPLLTDRQSALPASSSIQAIQAAQGRSAPVKLMKKSRLSFEAAIINAIRCNRLHQLPTHLVQENAAKSLPSMQRLTALQLDSME